jgi:hypothetical protein
MDVHGLVHANNHQWRRILVCHPQLSICFLLKNTDRTVILQSSSPWECSCPLLDGSFGVIDNYLSSPISAGVKKIRFFPAPAPN